MAEQERDVIEVLTEDHREAEQLFTELEAMLAAGGGDPERRQQLVDQVTIELVRHAVAEEVVVYPMVKEKVSPEEAERAKREHAEAEETMKRLERMSPDDDGFDQEIRTLMTEIREHVAEEEGQMFPHMRQVFSDDELRGMAGRVESIKKMAPTRPHPSVPNDPGARLAAGPVAGLFDRLRDLASGRGS